MYKPAELQRAGEIIRRGGLVAYPTEGVFGLGCDPANREAVLRLCQLKLRSWRQGLILIASRHAQLEGWIAPSPAEADRLAGDAGRPITWIVSAGPLAAFWITGGRDSLAVRLTQHPVAAGLCAAAGMPLVSTSANRNGHPAAQNALQARRWFGEDLHWICGGATGGLGSATEIRRACDGQVLRGSAAPRRT